MKTASKETIKKMWDDFDKTSSSADQLKEKAQLVIDNYEIKDRKDKNRKWLKIISELNLSDDQQLALNLAVARIIRQNKI